MSQLIDIKVPDIGDFTDVPVIEVFVKPGDVIKIDDALVTLESDKATMDVPSTVAGVVKEVLVQLGSKVGEGSVLIKVETGGAAVATPAPAAQVAAAAPAPAPATSSGPVEVRVPDIGDCDRACDGHPDRTVGHDRSGHAGIRAADHRRGDR